MAPRFFCQARLPRSDFPKALALDETAVQHLRVLRLAVGNAVTLFDGDDGEASAFIKTIDKKNVSVEISAWRNISRESPLTITLMQSLATGDKMDLIIQKAVELGVTAVIPVRAARSTLKLDGERADKRVAHWRGVAIAASEQCGRNVVASISAITSLNESLISAGILGIMHPEKTANASVSLVNWAQQYRGEPLTLLIGPEGGFTDAEVALAVGHGATVINIGKRVLRTETAGLAALAILQSHLGDLG